MRHDIRLVIAAGLLGLLQAGCTLAGDITPPPALATAQAAAPVPTSAPVEALTVPSSMPNLSSGAQLYADHCAGCHGTTGMGDGEMASGLSFPPAVLADPELADAASPGDWYEMVTNGNLERLMPPFTTLTDQQRWDVVGYALSLSLTGEQLQAGAALFSESCSECHSPPQFSSDSYQSASRADIGTLIQEGRGTEMPGFADQFDSQQLQELAGYVQSLAWSSAPESVAANESTTVSTAEVTGQISNGTAGGTVPAELQVTLLGFDGDQQVLERSATADAQGQFQLEQVEIAPGRLFFATLEYQDVVFRSEVGHAPTDGGPLELPLTIYETTSDLSALRVEQLHLLLDFPDPDTVQVLQLWVVGNSSDRVLAPGVPVSLPDAATNLAFEEGQLGDRYQLSSSGFVDTEPVPPGSAISQLVFAFDLPRQGSLDFRQMVQLPVDAVTVLVPTDGPRVSGLTDQGVLDLGGLSMHSYVGQSLAAGGELSFRIGTQAVSSSQLATIGFGAAALLTAAYVAFRTWAAKPAAEQEEGAVPGEASGEGRPGVSQSAGGEELDALLEAIAQLDLQHQAGKLTDADWQRRREALKQRALERMQAEGD